MKDLTFFVEIHTKQNRFVLVFYFSDYFFCFLLAAKQNIIFKHKRLNVLIPPEGSYMMHIVYSRLGAKVNNNKCESVFFIHNRVGWTMDR